MCQLFLQSFPSNIRARGTPSTVKCLRSDNGIGSTKKEFVSILDHHT